MDKGCPPDGARDIFDKLAESCAEEDADGAANEAEQSRFKNENGGDVAGFCPNSFHNAYFACAFDDGGVHGVHDADAADDDGDGGDANNDCLDDEEDAAEGIGDVFKGFHAEVFFAFFFVAVAAHGLFDAFCHVAGCESFGCFDKDEIVCFFLTGNFFVCVEGKVGMFVVDRIANAFNGADDAEVFVFNGDAVVDFDDFAKNGVVVREIVADQDVLVIGFF